MHPLRDDPLYMPCIDIIEDYDSCNGQLWKKFTGQCNDLYEKMSACMKEQRLIRRAENLEKSKQRKQERDELNEQLALHWWLDKPVKEQSPEAEGSS